MRVGAAAYVVLLLCVGGISQLDAQTASSPFSPRIRELVSRMTLDEKLMLTDGAKDPSDGGEAGYLLGIPRLGIPATRWVDGPGGIDNRYDATNLPQVLSVAASFDRKASADIGNTIGEEARATRMDVFLGPMVNIARVPNWGRNLTSFGEDPFLTSQLVAPMVSAVEKWGVMTTTKHFIANNQALNVNGLNHQPGADFVVDPRTLREIYLPGYEAAIAAGGAGIMDAYNKINGKQATANRELLTGVLRDESGWNGFVVSDWGAVHEPEAMAAGTDIEMPGVGLNPNIPGHYGEALRQAIAAGSVSMNDLDVAVMRLLSQYERMGMLDGTRRIAPEKVDVASGAAVARRVAVEGAVLLANKGTLPLQQTALKNLAVIGANAGQLAPSQGFGSAYGIESRRISPLDALRRLAPSSSHIRFAVGNDLTGVPVPSEFLTKDGEAPGLRRISDDGTPDTSDASLNFTGDRALPAGHGYMWKGHLRVPENGDYLLCIQSWGGGTTLKLNDKQIARSGMTPFGFGIPRKTSSLLPTTDGLDNGQWAGRLNVGQTYEIEIQGQAEPEHAMHVRLAWVTPELRRERLSEAVALAKTSDTAVVFAWQRGGELAENGEDLALSFGQDDLIEAVAAANPRTIVVLNTAGPVAMPWKDRVSAILEMWFPGQEGGWATADLLLGNANPSGHLPMTFPVKAQDSPVFAPGHAERYSGTAPNAGPANRVVYSEGIFVGYRYFDQNGIEPLFPFGFGLSYTTFSYSDLRVVPAEDGIDVHFTVRNTGKATGADVAQVYLSRPASAPLPMAPNSLAGFERVQLAAGESRNLVIHVGERSLCYWSETAKKWVRAGGDRTFSVGDSSRHVLLSTRVQIPIPGAAY